MRVYQAEPLTPPVYEVGESANKARIPIAAKNSGAAKRLYRSKMMHLAADAPLAAKKII